MNSLRWGVLGLTDRVEHKMLPALLQGVPNGRLYAVAGMGKSERLLRVMQTFRPERVFFYYTQLLEDPNVDAVYIPLPLHMHKKWIISALKAKKHVLCDAPLAVSERDIEEIRAAARQSGRRVMEAFFCLHSPLYPTLRGIIDAGEIGELRMVDAHFCFPLAERGTSSLVSRELSGGSINSVGCYNMLSIRQITRSEPLAVKAIAQYLASGVDGTVIASADMGSGVISQYKSSIVSANNRQIDIHGDEGYIQFRRAPSAWGPLMITLSNRHVEKTIHIEAPNPYTEEFTRFAACILNNAPLPVSIEESQRNARALSLLHEALQEEARQLYAVPPRVGVQAMQA